MTNDEAIDVLYVLEGVNEELGNKGEAEALRMAINALTAQPEPSQMARDIATIIENEKDMRVIAQPETHEKRTETHACDCISRQVAIDAILAVTGNSSVRELYEHVQEHGLSDMWSGGVVAAIDTIIALPSAQPEIIYCKDCVKHNKGHGYYPDRTFIGIKDCCPLVEIRGMAQGHEFDYQYCAYAERRTDD